MRNEYNQIIGDLARYEFGNGVYKQPMTDIQLWQIEDLEHDMKRRFPSLELAKKELKKAKGVAS